MKQGSQSVSSDIAFLFLGGMHQALHIAPVAAALSTRPGVHVTAYVTDAADATALVALLANLDGAAITVTTLELPRWLRSFLERDGREAEMKVPRLLFWRKRLARHDAVIAAERTSTLLKRLPGPQPVMIHIPHGAGDRAKGFERRIGLFDHVITAGPKDKRRMIAAGVVSPETCTVSGSIKLGAILNLQPEPPARLFANDRPIILYNPHCDTRLSSWSRLAWEFADRIAANTEFNLVIAPHIRLFPTLPADEQRRWRARPASDNVLIDFGSSRLTDMTYTRMADIYVGDVSSQVYEFLHRPRPCIFFDAHDANWHDNPDYLMWTFGPVCRTPDELMRALTGAIAGHDAFRAIQQHAVDDALGPVDGASAERAADQILAVITRHHPEAAPQ